MTVEEVRAKTECFFKLLDDNNLTKDRRHERLERVTKMKINWEQEKLAREGLSQIIEIQKLQNPTKVDKRFLAFMRKLAILELAFKSEELKHHFKLILNPDEVTFDDELEYGKLMGRILDKLRILDTDEREKYKDLFFVNIRNSLAHANILNVPNCFQYEIANRREVVKLNDDELFMKHKEINEIESCFNDYVQNKVISGEWSS